MIGHRRRELPRPWHDFFDVASCLKRATLNRVEFVQHSGPSYGDSERILARMNLELRRQVINVYKGARLDLRLHNHATPLILISSPELLEMGKHYPLGYEYFRPRLHKAFMSQAHLKDEEQIRQGIKRAEYVKKEIEALYFLKKYRSMKNRYSD